MSCIILMDEIYFITELPKYHSQHKHWRYPTTGYLQRSKVIDGNFCIYEQALPCCLDLGIVVRNLQKYLQHYNQKKKNYVKKFLIVTFCNTTGCCYPRFSTGEDQDYSDHMHLFQYAAAMSSIAG